MTWLTVLYCEISGGAVELLKQCWGVRKAEGLGREIIFLYFSYFSWSLHYSRCTGWRHSGPGWGFFFVIPTQALGCIGSHVSVTVADWRDSRSSGHLRPAWRSDDYLAGSVHSIDTQISRHTETCEYRSGWRHVARLCWEVVCYRPHVLEPLDASCSFTNSVSACNCCWCASAPSIWDLPPFTIYCATSCCSWRFSWMDWLGGGNMP